MDSYIAMLRTDDLHNLCVISPFSVVKISDLFLIMTSRLVSLVQFQNSGILNIYKMVIFVQKRHGCGKKTLDLQYPFCLDNGRWLLLDFQR